MSRIEAIRRSGIGQITVKIGRRSLLGLPPNFPWRAFLRRSAVVLLGAATAAGCASDQRPDGDGGEISARAPSDSVQPPDIEVDAERRQRVINNVLARLNVAYVYPETAIEMERSIRARATRGEYDRLATARLLADSLTSHLREVSGDKHLMVRFTANAAEHPGTPELRQTLEQQRIQTNFGIARVDRMPGNIGYLKLDYFAPALGGGAQEAISEVMVELSRTDAIIIDLRDNEGGAADMVRLVASYLFGPEPVHLNSIERRLNSRTEEYWTLRELGGPRLGPDRPAFVLTSSRTFSAAEEFAYDLQQLRRAIVVGERTAGGAHLVSVQAIDHGFSITIPTGRAVNPITKTNWEGAGVAPNVGVPGEEALSTAHLLALRSLLRSSTDPDRSSDLERMIRTVER